MARSTSTDAGLTQAPTVSGKPGNGFLAFAASPTEQALWQRIQSHRFNDETLKLDFVARLARDHGWSRDDANSAVTEYRRFCFLAVVMPEAATPSPVVDEVWHLHLTYTRDYWALWCGTALNRPLHHQPTAGGAAERHRYREQYAETLAAYQRYFGPPPAEFWPSSHKRFRDPDRFRWIDCKRVLLLPRPRLGWPSTTTRWLLLTALAGLLVTPLALALPMNPMDWRGGPFLALYTLLMISMLFVVPLLRRRLSPQQPLGVIPTLSAYEIAYLEGGASRVVDTGIAALLSEGLISVSAKEAPRALGRPPGLAPPLPELYAAIGAGTSFSRLPNAIGRFVAELRGRLTRQGLILGPDQRRAINLKTALPLIALGGFGLLKIGIGLSRDRPVGILVFLTVIVLSITLITIFNAKDRSPRGAMVLDELKRRHRHATLAPRDVDLALAVALGGTAALAGTAWADYHTYRTPSSGSGSGDGGSGGGDGSGCGSGCGGCGGGGGD